MTLDDPTYCEKCGTLLLLVQKYKPNINIFMVKNNRNMVDVCFENEKLVVEIGENTTWQSLKYTIDTNHM